MIPPRTFVALIYTLLADGVKEFGDPKNFTDIGYVSWIPTGSQRTDLYCPARCAEEECCSCRALTCWEIDPQACSVISYLHIEYLDILGTTDVIAERNNATMYELVHTDGRMASFPRNMCYWNATTTVINFDGNRIKSIEQIKCMVNLYVLKMDDNLIDVIYNNTFTDFKFLRTLSVANNNLKYLDPFTVRMSNGNIHNVNFSSNEFISVDISNVLRPGPWCMGDFQGSFMRNITNLTNYTITDNELLGPGSINFNNSRALYFFNLTDIGIAYDAVQSKLSGNGHFYFDESSIECDCSLYPLIYYLDVRTYDLWPNMLDSEFNCTSPHRMKDISLRNIFDSKNYDLLTCDLMENCPYKCHCSDRPSHGVVTVNCSGAGLTELPHDMPLGYWNNYKLDLHLDDNAITSIDDRHYIKRIANLNMNGNPVSSFPQTVAKHLEVLETAELDSYIGSSIPVHFQKYDPRKVNFGGHPLVCDCDNIWIGRWLRSYSAHNKLSCYANSQIVSAHVVDENYLQCNAFDDRSPFILLAGFLSVLVSLFVLTLLGYCFRYELLVLKRRCFHKEQHPNTDKIFDVFVSMNEDNHDVFMYVASQVRERLLDLGYSVFIPWFDKVPGASDETEVTTAISYSMNFVIFMCEMYNSSKWCQSEFEMIWSKYSADSRSKLIIINFDALKTKDVHSRPLKACLRAGTVLDFKLRADKLLDRLVRSVGPCILTNFDDEIEIKDTDRNEVSDKNGYNMQKKPGIQKKKLRMRDQQRDYLIDTENLRDDRSKLQNSSVRGLAGDTSGEYSKCNRRYRRCYLSDTDNPWIRKGNLNFHKTMHEDIATTINEK